MSDNLDTTTPLNCAVLTCSVGDFPSWLDEFKGPDSTKFHTDILKAKYTMAGKCPEQRDGKDVILELNLLPASNADAVAKVYQFDGPPYVGGPDLIKNGVMMPPFNAFQFKVRATRNHGSAEDDGPLMAVVLSHAVNNFEECYTKTFKVENTDERMNPMGIVKSIFGQGPDTADGKPTAVIVYYFKKDSEDKVRAFCTMKGPPFVGGPDFIKNGLVIPPLTQEIYASVEHTETH